MAAMDSLQRRWDEVEALMAIYAEDGEFQLIEGEPPGGDELASNGDLRFRIRLCTASIPWTLLVTLPPEYPTLQSPSFLAEVSSSDAGSRAAATFLKEKAEQRLLEVTGQHSGEALLRKMVFQRIFSGHFQW